MTAQKPPVLVPFWDFGPRLFLLPDDLGEMRDDYDSVRDRMERPASPFLADAVVNAELIVRYWVLASRQRRRGDDEKTPRMRIGTVGDLTNVTDEAAIECRKTLGLIIDLIS